MSRVIDIFSTPAGLRRRNAQLVENFVQISKDWDYETLITWESAASNFHKAHGYIPNPVKESSYDDMVEFASINTHRGLLIRFDIDRRKDDGMLKKFYSQAIFYDSPRSRIYVSASTAVEILDRIDRNPVMGACVRQHNFGYIEWLVELRESLEPVLNRFQPTHSTFEAFVGSAWQDLYERWLNGYVPSDIVNAFLEDAVIDEEVAADLAEVQKRYSR